MNGIDYLCGKLRRLYLQLDSGGLLAPNDIARCVESAERVQAEIERLRAENAKLREALEKIVAENDDPVCCGYGASECCNQPFYGLDRAKGIATAVLLTHIPEAPK